MDDKTDIGKWTRQGLLIFGLYTLYALIILLQSYTVILRYPGPKQQTFSGAVGLSATFAYIWAILTPFIAFLGRRLPVNQKNLLRNLFLHLCVGIAFGIIHRTVFFVLHPIVSPGMLIIPESTLNRILLFSGHVLEDLFHYIIIAAIYQAYLHFKESQDRQFRLQQAEMHVLKTQLHPHFLFNTLNAISSLSFDAPEVASRVIAQLSDLLRFSLKSEHAAETSLKEEIDFVRKYLQIQQTLLEERLTVNWEISPETLDACVPNMFLQPLVENSIRHGIAPKEAGGTIEILSRRVDETLEIEVKDNGLGISSNGNKTSGDGIGLSNTRARLRNLYGEAHRFDLSELAEGGVRIFMTIPFREGKSMPS